MQLVGSITIQSQKDPDRRVSAECHTIHISSEAIQPEVFLYSKQIDNRVPIPETLQYVTDFRAQGSRFLTIAHLFSSLCRADRVLLVVPLRFGLGHCVQLCAGCGSHMRSGIL